MAQRRGGCVGSAVCQAGGWRLYYQGSASGQVMLRTAALSSAAAAQVNYLSKVLFLLVMIVGHVARGRDRQRPHSHSQQDHRGARA